MSATWWTPPAVVLHRDWHFDLMAAYHRCRWKVTWPSEQAVCEYSLRPSKASDALEQAMATEADADVMENVGLALNLL